MATIPTQTHPLLAVPFNATTDFTVLADHCETFAETLIESNDPALKMALCGRINTCLTPLQPTLLEPVPPHLVESLTVDTLPRFRRKCNSRIRATSLVPVFVDGERLGRRLWLSKPTMP